MSISLETTVTFPCDLEQIIWRRDRCTTVIAGRVIEFTRIEYEILQFLSPRRAVTYADLARDVYGCPADRKKRAMMDKHIDKIRTRISGTGIYIYCVLGYGYMLLPEIESQ